MSLQPHPANDVTLHSWRVKMELQRSSTYPNDQLSYRATDQGHLRDNSATFELAKYLAWSQVMSSSLTKFDDQPENYQAWTSSFLSAIEDLELTAGEELDLLIKWLGKQSAEQARRTKSVSKISTYWIEDDLGEVRGVLQFTRSY